MDIDIAWNLLNSENKSIVIVKKGNVIFSSQGRGIKPLYMALAKYRDQLQDSSVADKVVGKAASMIYIHAGIKELHTKLISENAIKLLKDTSIKYSYSKSVPYIKNLDGSSMCPVETLSLNVSNIDDLLMKISNFLQV
ncbi:MAG: DUF1893 domain-containing protein [Tissierellia bacterium]|nr:DUF1893 domain-containing protein [Tissierellia bacterium]